MKNYLKSLLFILLFSACHTIEKAPKPENLIPEDKMVDILVDLAKIDGALNYNRQDFKEIGFYPKNYIYKKYGIDSIQLSKSNAYYIEQFEISKRMYEEVRARLEKKLTTLDSLEKAEDSIRRRKKGLKKVVPLSKTPPKKQP